jgi:hypothetical protein
MTYIIYQSPTRVADKSTNKKTNNSTTINTPNKEKNYTKTTEIN